MIYQNIWESVKDRAWQLPSEFIPFLQFIAVSNIKSILEIGTYKGGSAEAFIQVGAAVTSIDIIKQPEVSKLEEESCAFKFLERGPEIYPGYLYKTDLLFIDGDHSYEAVKKDYDEFRNYVRDEGFVAFHDAKDSKLHKKQNNGVSKFYKEIRGDRYMEFFDVSEEWGGIAVIRV